MEKKTILSRIVLRPDTRNQKRTPKISASGLLSDP
jgi:hypothetical protein